MQAGVSSATFREFCGSLIPSDDLCAPGFVRTMVRGVEIETRPRSLSLKCVLKGEEVYETPGRRLVLRAGELALIGADQGVMFCAPRGKLATGVSVFFPVEFQPALFRNFKGFRDFSALKVNGVSTALDAQSQALAALSGAADKAGLADVVMTKLMAAAARALGEVAAVSVSVPARKSRTRHELATRLLRARAFMSTHACARRSVEEIAAQFGFSRHNFARLFKSAFDASPRSFREATRLRLAADLIATTDAELSIIAARAGYADYPTFSKAFRRRHSISPAEMRKRAQTDMAESARPS